jgi:hypothetical protein
MLYYGILSLCQSQILDLCGINIEVCRQVLLKRSIEASDGRDVSVRADDDDCALRVDAKGLMKLALCG